MRHSFLRTTALTVVFVASIGCSTAWADGLSWTERTSAGSRNWSGIASSSDGTKLAAVDTGGYIYTSTDSGATWTERTSAGSRDWYCIASSSNGTKLVAAVYAVYEGFMEPPGYIYTSTDSGVTWTERTSAGQRDWLGVASSSDGTNLAAVVLAGYIYTSTDSGAAWTERTAPGSHAWSTIASSSDGTKLAACAQNAYIYTSTNSGGTWTQRTASGSRVWFAIASSSDGTKLAAGAYGGYTYTSTDSGATWTERTAPGSRSWNGLASSSDGSTILAAAQGNYIFVSTDSGATWTQQTSLGTANWFGVASSSNGTRLAAVALGGSIYTTGPAVSAPTVTTAAVSDITTTTASSGGNVTSDGGAAVTARGVCWSTSANPTIANSHTTDGTGIGEFASSLTSLSPGTTYHVRAYAINSAGTAYGGEKTFATVAVHTVTFVAGAHGSLTGTVSQMVAHGSDCTAVTAVPDVGYQFVNWSGTGGFGSTSNPLIINRVTSNLTITANFVALPVDRGAPDLRVAIEARTETSNADSLISPGEHLSVGVSVQNAGDAEATGVRALVPVPDNMEFVSATVLGTASAEVLPAQVSVEGNVVIIEVGDLAAGELFRVRLVLRAKSSGSARFIVHALSSETPDGVEAAPSEVMVEDEYYVLVRHAPLCGMLGLLPLLVLAAGLGWVRRGRTCERPSSLRSTVASKHSA